MRKEIGIGIQSFEEIRERNCFYVDKTPFIREWWESMDSVTLINRPRRFGKTMNMSMLHAFFSVDYKDRGDLFEGLTIWEDEKYRELQGSYPVLYLSFANVKEDGFAMTRKKICQLIVKLYEKNKFLLDSDLLGEPELRYFKRVSEEMDDSDATLSLYQLSDYLGRYYGKKVIILLDEYDTPMQEAYVNGFWPELVSFTRSLFNSTFKTNPYMERGIMTGITRISKESIFSDLNNLEVITTTSNQYTAAFGFTEEEVFAALEKYGYADRKEEVKRWYDGFIFGKQKDIYNPWSILNFLKKGVTDTYWANTSSNGLVSKLVRESDNEIKDAFEELLKGKSIRCSIDEQILYDQLDDDVEAIWSLLLASGYLKVISYDRLDEISEDEDPQYELTCTNLEVRRMFRVMIKGWFQNVKGDYHGFIKALLLGDLKAMNVYMNKVALQTFSYFDTGRNPSCEEPERFYHGFVLGLLVDLAKDYTVTSNRESGFGRYDVMIEPKERKKGPAFLLEFKVHDREDETTLKDTVAAALAQIEEKRYGEALIAKGIPAENIRNYGFAFEGKKVLIGGGAWHEKRDWNRNTEF